MKKRIVSLLVALAMALDMVMTSGIVAPASAADSGFVIENGVLTLYTGTSVDVVIPDGVTAIDRYAFFNKEVKVRTADIRSLVIPEGVTEIPDMGFNPCLSLERVTLPNSLVSIGHNAFSDAERLTELRLPDGLKTIGYGAFSNCTSLTTVYIPDSVTEIGTGAFSGCTSLINVRIPSTASLGTGTFRDAPWLENQRWWTSTPSPAVPG